MDIQPVIPAREKGRLSPLKLEHAGIRTGQIQPMIAWYVAVLEADISFSNDKIAFLAYDEQNHRLSIVVRPGTVPKPSNSAGIDHLAFTYADLGELVTTYERLKTLGIMPARAMDHGSSTSLYYADPDGNHVELKVDNFPTMEQQHAWLRTPEFAENPIGTPIDPDEMTTRFHDGTVRGR